MHSPRASKRLTADVVEVDVAVHGGARVGLGDDEERRVARGSARAPAGARRRAGVRVGRSAARRGRCRRPAPRRRGRPRARRRVLAVAEEGEVVVRRATRGSGSASRDLGAGRCRRRRRGLELARRWSRAWARILGQSSTASRTFSSTWRRRASSSRGASARGRRSISTCIHDSRTMPRGARLPRVVGRREAPSAGRR